MGYLADPVEHVGHVLLVGDFEILGNSEISADFEHFFASHHHAIAVRLRVVQNLQITLTIDDLRGNIIVIVWTFLQSFHFSLKNSLRHKNRFVSIDHSNFF